MGRNSEEWRELGSGYLTLCGPDERLEHAIRVAVFTHARFPLPVVSEGDSEQHKELLLGRYNVT